MTLWNYGRKLDFLLKETKKTVGGRGFAYNTADEESELTKYTYFGM